MRIFAELKASIEEAVEIKAEKQAASRSTSFEVTDVKAIRSQLGVSQIEFAVALGMSIDIVKSWESKRRNPTGLAAKVLAIIKDDPEYFKVLASY